jgi:hypothetical protein
MELTDMSESSGVAQDSPFHRRDASRVLALQGDASQAALEFIQYFDDLDAYQDQDRALTVLVCQVAEIDSLFGHSAGDELLDAITKSGHPRATPTAAQARLADSIRGLHVRQSGLDAVDYAVAVVGVAANEARASEAIFRFDVPDLAKLRRLVTDA